MNYIDKLLPFVKRELAEDESGHGVNHAIRVYKNALKLLKEEKANEKIVLTAALLHDTIDHKLFKDVSKQKEKMKEYLHSLGYLEDEMSHVLEIASTISFRNGNYKELKTIEAAIVRDADRLDAIGAIGIIRTIEYGTSHHRPFYEEENLKEENGKITFNKVTETTLSHFYEKLLLLPGLMLTDYAKKEAEKRIKIMEEFLQEFYKELE